MSPYPKRLIEVDLPIARISAHARAERGVRSGRITKLHMWWAHRPLAACRAVILASLWPDPVDLTDWLQGAVEAGQTGPMGPEIRAPRNVKLEPGAGVVIRPQRFLDEARTQMTRWARIGMNGDKHPSGETIDRLIKIREKPTLLHEPEALRAILLDFIADFANWDNSTHPDFLATSRDLVQAAHEALGGDPGSRPMVIDPFTGGGSIPLEALRVGADAFASDLNPIPILLNGLLLESIPILGTALTESVKTWSSWFKGRLAEELSHFYPQTSAQREVLACFWARTVVCEGPGCGVTYPLLSRLQITSRADPPIIASLDTTDPDRVTISVGPRPANAPVGAGTARGAKPTCPKCHYTMSQARYRALYKESGLGECLFAVVERDVTNGQRFYRSSTQADVDAFNAAHHALRSVTAPWAHELSAVPDEPLSEDEPRRLNVRLYGYERWGELFNARQALALVVAGSLVSEARNAMLAAKVSSELADATAIVLALATSNASHYLTNMSTYLSDGMISAFIQSSSIAMRADYAEANPLMQDLVGGIDYQIQQILQTLERLECVIPRCGSVQQSAAQALQFPNDAADLLATDPPYYHSIPYADLSDLFFVWLKRFLSDLQLSFMRSNVTPKAEEATQSLPHSRSPSRKDKAHYENAMRESFEMARMAVKPGGIGFVVFAHSSTSGWEAMVQALLSAGWMISATWPIETENVNRILANRQSTLASSVHLVCRPREGSDGRLAETAIGEWREVLSELPRRLREWMPRLAAEGVVGADAIFACLGPALEIFSRYSRVEKASGDAVPLREYFEQVWAAVSNEALSMIFTEADAAGLEPDGRLTAMWLWTLGAGAGVQAASQKGAAAAVAEGETEVDDEEGEGAGGKKAKTTGFTLEFDAARKIAQGLGAHLEKMPSIVEIKGDTARLLSVAERTRYLFGKDSNAEDASAGRRRKKKAKQLGLYEELEEVEQEQTGGAGFAIGAIPMGASVLDRVHQSMILFAAGRGEALKRFLVEDGAGTDAKFWKLAQSLSALYPPGTDEKRWVDGVLARKKGVGL